MSMFSNGIRVFKSEDQTISIDLIVEGRVVNNLVPHHDNPPLKPGLYDFDLNYLGEEAEDGSLIPAPEQ